MVAFYECFCLYAHVSSMEDKKPGIIYTLSTLTPLEKAQIFKI